MNAVLFEYELLSIPPTHEASNPDVGEDVGVDVGPVTRQSLYLHPPQDLYNPQP